MAFGIDDAISAVAGLGETIVKTIWPNPTEEANAKAAIITAQVDAAVRQLQAAQAVMLAEAQSSDPWTSRARPTFLYVMYACILAAIPMGVLFAFSPEVANRIATGFGAWLNAIPESMWQLFGVGYLGYAGARTWEKTKGIGK
jgi:hypothetical protein